MNLIDSPDTDFETCVKLTLVTQPMMQRRPNQTELRSMDSYIQILCRFQKSERKVPPPSQPYSKKSPFTPPKENFSHPFFLLFWNLDIRIHRS